MCGAVAGGPDITGVDATKEAVIQGIVTADGQPVSPAYVRLLDASGEFTAAVARLRLEHPTFHRKRFFSGNAVRVPDGRPGDPEGGDRLNDIVWLHLDGRPMAPWQSVGVSAGAELSFAGARDGTLAIMAGGRDEDIDRIAGILADRRLESHREQLTELGIEAARLEMELILAESLADQRLPLRASAAQPAGG